MMPESHTESRPAQPAVATSDPADLVTLPASFAQELLWMRERAAPGDIAYNVPRTRRLVGPLDVNALRRAFDAIVARHEILRTTYGFEGEQAVQVIHPPRAVEFVLLDVSARPVAERDAEAERLVRELARRPFDLTRDVLMRVAVIRLGDDEHVLHLDSHHIAFDGWSRDVLFRDLSALYVQFTRGADANLPALPIQYADFALWEREQLQGDRLRQLLEYWREELAGAETVLELPTDFPRPPVASVDGITERITLAPALHRALRALAHQHDATVYMTLLAAYATLLHRYTGQADVLVGSPVAGRARAETEDLIGYFASTVVQRARFGDDPTFARLLDQIRDSALRAYEHRDVPFEKLVLDLDAAHQSNRSPLFQVVFTMLGGGAAAPGGLGDVEVRQFGSDEVATKFDLTLFMAEQGEHLVLTLRARADLFARDSVVRMLGHLERLLEVAIAHPDEPIRSLSFLTDAEQDELARWSTGGSVPATIHNIVESIGAQARRHGDRPAVVDASGVVTYSELDTRANQIAHHLVRRGVGAGAPVVLLFDRSSDFVVAMLAVLRAGGAYVPVPAETPPIRVARQVADSGARVAVTRSANAAILPPDIDVICLDADSPAIDREPATPPAVPIALDDPAYVLFTSGSTGVPKGVVVTHGNLAYYVAAISARLGVPDADTSAPGAPGWHFGLGASWGADLGHTALFPALTSGGTLHVLAAGTTSEPAAFVRAGAAQPLDVLKLTPSHWGALTAGLSAAELATVLPRQWLVLGGEALRWTQAAPVARALARIGSRLLNHYGPTEATVGATTWEVVPPPERPERPESSESPERVERSERASQAAATVPIGRPLPGVRAYVVDAHGQRVPVGVAGELWLGGAGIARGYVGAPARTAERFGPDPFSPESVRTRPEARLYRTGDRVRWRRDGTLEFLGRVDGGQVKLRGYRVELGEIDATLAQHPAVAQGAVLALAPAERARQSIAADDARSGDELALYAFVVPNTGFETGALPAALGAWLAERLPEYMIPQRIAVLDALPLTANGKLDRATLASMTTADATADVHVAPRTPVEDAIASIWREVLKKDRVSVTDDFMALGGHSLHAIRILGKLSRQFGVRLPLRALFEAPTVEQLSELVTLEMRLAALDQMSEEDATHLAGVPQAASPTTRVTDA